MHEVDDNKATLSCSQINHEADEIETELIK